MTRRVSALRRRRGVLKKHRRAAVPSRERQKASRRRLVLFFHRSVAAPPREAQRCAFASQRLPQDRYDDLGSHHVCIKMDSTSGGNFCEVTGQPNWCDTTMACDGDRRHACKPSTWIFLR